MPEFLVKGHPVSFARSGSGEPVVLLHSAGSSARQWKTLASALENRCLCYMPDFPGHGASPLWPDEIGSTLSDHAAIVDALADRIGGRFHLIGHSHGGAVAITYAARRAGTLRSMTLVEPTLMHLLRLCSRSKAWREAEELGNKHIEAVAEGRSAEIADDFMPYWVGHAAWQGMPEDRRTAIVATMPAVAQFWRAVFAEMTPAEAYVKIRVPTLLIRGSQTRTTTYTIIEVLSDLLPLSRIEEVEGAGHMAPLTHAPQFNGAVVTHILQWGSTE